MCTPWMRSSSEFFSNKDHVRRGNAMRILGSDHVHGSCVHHEWGVLQSSWATRIMWGGQCNERPGKWSCDRCWPMRGLKINFTGRGRTDTQTLRLLDCVSENTQCNKNPVLLTNEFISKLNEFLSKYFFKELLLNNIQQWHLKSSFSCVFSRKWYTEYIVNVL